MKTKIFIILLTSLTSISVFGIEQNDGYEDETYKQKDDKEEMNNYKLNYEEEGRLLPQLKKSLIIKDTNQDETVQEENKVFIKPRLN